MIIHQNLVSKQSTKIFTKYKKNNHNYTLNASTTFVLILLLYFTNRFVNITHLEEQSGFIGKTFIVFPLNYAIFLCNFLLGKTNSCTYVIFFVFKLLMFVF